MIKLLTFKELCVFLEINSTFLTIISGGKYGIEPRLLVEKRKGIGLLF